MTATEQTFKIYKQGNDFYISEGHQSQNIHWVDDELDAEIENVYLMFITGYGNSAVVALYSAFNEGEAVGKLIEETSAELEDIAWIEQVQIITI